jgi:hypothetical protein
MNTMKKVVTSSGSHPASLSKLRVSTWSISTAEGLCIMHSHCAKMSWLNKGASLIWRVFDVTCYGIHGVRAVHILLMLTDHQQSNFVGMFI